MVYEKGFYSAGKYVARISKTKASREYDVWTKMLQRCYDNKFQIKCPTYKGCEVSDYFLHFQEFAEWCNNQIGFSQSFHLDKDLLHKGNKLYCPTKCLFLPQELNKFLIGSDASRGELPKGISLHKASNKYQVRVREEGKSNYLGLFTDIELAKDVYKTNKERIAKKLALKWQNEIDDKAFYSLFNYEEEFIN